MDTTPAEVPFAGVPSIIVIDCIVDDDAAAAVAADDDDGDDDVAMLVVIDDVNEVEDNAVVEHARTKHVQTVVRFVMQFC